MYTSSHQVHHVPTCLPACLPAPQLCAKNPACGAYVWNPYFSLVCVLKVREEGRCRSTPTPVGYGLQAPTCLCACIRALGGAGPDHTLHALLHHIAHPGRPCWHACLASSAVSLHHHPTLQSPTGWTRTKMQKEYEGIISGVVMDAGSLVPRGSQPPPPPSAAARQWRQRGGGGAAWALTALLAAVLLLS